MLGVGAPHTRKREDELKAQFPELNYLALSELFGGPLLTEFSRSLTRLKVQQYQRFFHDADRVVILLHNDPDPDAMASGLALRNVLRRTKQTAFIAALQGVTRPENLRMMNLLDIHVEILKPAQVLEFDRIAMVDVQPHYFGGAIDRVDLVIDHHPEQSGYTAVYKDIRPDYGSTSTILTEHLRAIDVNISERTATAMLYAIKSDTLFFNRQANRVDIEAFSYLYPLADATLIRKMEGAEITMDRLAYVLKAKQHGRMEEQVFCAFLGTSPREDFIPYVADFYLQLENVKWTIVSGIVNESLVMSVRNLGYSKQRGRVRAQVLQRHRQRRRTPLDGQGGRAAGRLPQQVRQPAGRPVHRQGAAARARLPARAPAKRQEARQSRQVVGRRRLVVVGRGPRSGPAGTLEIEPQADVDVARGADAGCRPEERRRQVAGVAGVRHVVQDVLRLDEQLHAVA